jgi:hypothetical protein
LATCDHVLMTDGFKQIGVGYFNDALNYYDFGADYAWSDPVRSQDVADTTKSFKETFGPTLDIQLIYCDNHSAVAAACRRLGITRRKAPPGDSQSNGVIESLNRRIQAGARAHLSQAGLPCCFWPYAVMHWCTLRNTCRRGELDTPYERRHGVPFPAERLPLGLGILYYPTNTKYKHQSKCEARLSYGILMGYVMMPGNAWSGMYMVCDINDFVNLPLHQHADPKLFDACRRPPLHESHQA